MATITPRRVLGSLDTNKGIPKSVSPKKNAVVTERSGLSSSVIASPRKSVFRDDSTRADEELEEVTISVPQSPGLKRKSDTMPMEGNGTPDGMARKRTCVDTGETREEDTGAEQILPSTQDTARDSPSTSQVFDENGSQLTVSTEANTEADIEDDIVVSQESQSIPVASRRVSPREARDNVETLRLRLQVAMYKVRTNQISTPLDQLHVIPTRRGYLTRSPLRSAVSTASGFKRTVLPPSSSTRLAQVGQSCMLARNTPSMKPVPTLSPALTLSPAPALSPAKSSFVQISPSKRDTPLRRAAPAFATPVLPRMRRDGGEILRAGRAVMSGGDGDGRDEGEESDDECEIIFPRLTSSVVKKGAADGLLQLMGMGERRATNSE